MEQCYSVPILLPIANGQSPPTTPLLIYIYIYITCVHHYCSEYFPDFALRTLSPFSLTLSAVMVSARRPDVVALETHKV